MIYWWFDVRGIVMTIEISVIVPVYNVEKYLDKCIQSILDQSFKNFELILIDDGSFDSSGLICDKYLNLDNRVIVRHQVNKGQSAARNVGLDCACGKYITFIDSDDWVEPQYLEFLYNKINNVKVDIVRGAFKQIGVNVNKNIVYGIDGKEIVIKNNGNNIIDSYLSGKIMPMMTAGLYDAKLFQRVRFPEHLCAEDIYVTFLILYYSKSIILTNEILYNIRENMESVTHKKIKIIDICNTWKCVRDFALTNGLLCNFVEKIDSLIARLLYHFIRDAKQDGVRIIVIHNDTLCFINANLNIVRRLLLKFVILKNSVKVCTDIKK